MTLQNKRALSINENIVQFIKKKLLHIKLNSAPHKTSKIRFDRTETTPNDLRDTRPHSTLIPDRKGISKSTNHTALSRIIYATREIHSYDQRAEII